LRNSSPGGKRGSTELRGLHSITMYTTKAVNTWHGGCWKPDPYNLVRIFKQDRLKGEKKGGYFTAIGELA
jgi:hypothetical protein